MVHGYYKYKGNEMPAAVQSVGARAICTAGSVPDCRPTQGRATRVRPSTGLEHTPGSEDDKLEANGPEVFHDVGAVLRQ